MLYSVIIPVYKNEESIPRLINTLTEVFAKRPEVEFEVVFVVDGSPDNSFMLLKNMQSDMPFLSKVLLLSRNFGALEAVKAGMAHANGDFNCVLAADLQEPPELLLDMLNKHIKTNCDLVLGVRNNRNDPLLTKLFSITFWMVYRKLVVKEVPRGGVDIFACSRRVRELLAAFRESRTSLIGLIFWVGFTKEFVEYDRLERIEGVSAWSFSKKFDYMLDSIFSFTDLPIKAMLGLGGVGVIFSLALGIVVLTIRLGGGVSVPGYTATLLTILFMGSLNLLAVGLVGGYAWRCYENSKGRPNSIVSNITISPSHK